MPKDFPGATHLNGALHLRRSIHGNPVKDGLVADPADWPYSNYQEWTGQRNGSLYDPEFVRANFPYCPNQLTGSLGFPMKGAGFERS